jgi:DNA-directed RNA polymerase II subunit RPB1
MRPRTKGPNDPRLGTLDRQYYCETCEEGQKECPGHYGHIELATPVFHIGETIYSDRTYEPALIQTGFITKTKKLLETVCHNCGKIKADMVSFKNPKSFFLRYSFILMHPFLPRLE